MVSEILHAGQAVSDASKGIKQVKDAAKGHSFIGAIPAQIKALVKFALGSKEGRRLIMYILSTVLPDAGVLTWVGDIISDEDMKDIAALKDKKGPLTLDEVALLSLASKAPHLDDDADDSVIDDYAKHLHNYLYTYKPEAQSLDPTIDPEEEHIGIMAQDLEKVNPACVHEDEHGVKTVDSGRLALMNAGSIADLARRMDKLEAQLGIS